MLNNSTSKMLVMIGGKKSETPETSEICDNKQNQLLKAPQLTSTLEMENLLTKILDPKSKQHTPLE